MGKWGLHACSNHSDYKCGRGQNSTDSIKILHLLYLIIVFFTCRGIEVPLRQRIWDTYDHTMIMARFFFLGPCCNAINSVYSIKPAYFIMLNEWQFHCKQLF